MVAAGATALMSTSEGSSSKVAENITVQYEVQHGQQSTDSLVRRTSKSGSTDSIKKKEGVKSPIQNKTASIRETKTSRLRAASIVSPVDASNISRRIGSSDCVTSSSSQSSGNFPIKQKCPMSSTSSLSHFQSTSSSTSSSIRDKDRNHRRHSNKFPESDEKQCDLNNCDKYDRRSKRLTRSNFVDNKSLNFTEMSASNCNNNSGGFNNQHRRHYDSKDSTRRVTSQQSASHNITISSSSRGSSTHISSSGMKRSAITQRSGEDGEVYCNSGVDNESGNEDINGRKLSEGVAKLRRARHSSRRFRDRKELFSNANNEVYQSLNNNAIIDNSSTLSTRKMIVDEMTKEQLHQFDDVNEDDTDEDTSMLEEKGQYITESRNNITQMESHFKATVEQVKSNSAKDSNLHTAQRDSPRSDDSPCHHRDISYDRFNTQPVTYQEIKDVALQNKRTNNTSVDIESVQTTFNRDTTLMNDDVDPSKLSLAERVRLFNHRIATESVAKAGIPLDRVPRRPHSRFKTQPVTSEEVEVASRRIPTIISDLKRTPSNTLDVPLTTPTTITHQLHNDPLKSILKSSSFHTLDKRQKSTELITRIDSDLNSDEINREMDMKSHHNYSEDLNDGVIFRNKIDRVRNSCSVESKMNESTVPSSQYINSNSLSTESALATRKYIRQRNFLMTNKSRCMSECESIDENILNSDIIRHVRPISSVQSVDIPSISIADRLAALQRSGSSDWKRRITSEPVPSTIIEKCNENDCEKIMDICQREKDELALKQRRLADRLEKLESAAEGWRKRVAITDAVKFSVAGKMRIEQPNSFHINSKPFETMGGNCVSTERKKRISRTEYFKKEGLKDNTSIVNIDEYVNELGHENLSKDHSDNDDDESKNNPPYSIQYVPRADDETFTSFFQNLSVDKCLEESLDVAESDFDVVTSYSELLGTRRTTKTQRRNVHSRNPLKALAARTDLKDEYTDINTGVAEKIMKITNVEKLAQNSSLAVEALAGLASTENFNAVTLKNITDDNIGFGNKLRPYKDFMLILVKGRRHVQARLVEAIASNVNSGDNYILVTKNELYHYIGKYSNIIEKSRAAEIALRIQQNKDLGCRALQVITIGEDIPTCTLSQIRNFWKLLGEDDPLNLEVIEAGHPDEDELYESALIDTNAVYEVTNDRLIPLEKYWGTIPKIKMLDPSKILVFDFGTEMYIWNGKIASFEKRKIATRLAQDLWNEGYDYSECTACPIDAASMIGQRKKNYTAIKKNVKRPEWCLLAKLTQHMETILFREKFLDWPNVSGVIRMKQPKEKEQVDTKINIEPPDVNLMIQPNNSVVDLVLEGYHLGRGDGWFDEELSRNYLVVTTDISVWHIDEYSFTHLNKSSIGQFYTGDSYIVRWMYTITMTGRELSGLPSKHVVEGRDRCAYFIWQGKNASLNKQGTAALLTVELDKEQGPQIRVVESFEPAAFLNLFKGGMVIHLGRRLEKINAKNSRVYICRGAEKSETSLIEVPRSPKQLRSRGSMVFLDNKLEKIQVWHGRHSLSHVRNNAFHAANILKDKCPIESGLCANKEYTVEEIYEGEEPIEFFQGGMDKKLYLTLNRKNIPHHTPRLFHFSSISGEFTASEVLCSHRSHLPTPFPFLQEELYQVNQPALFLLDNKEELWLWQGWWPDSGSDDQTGSGAVRWQAERRAAMTVALQYWKELHPSAKKCAIYLVWAGLEPREFINLFPTWIDHDEVAKLNIEDGRAPGEVLSVESELARLMQSTYPPAQLLQRPLPEGVDPTTLELYLSPQHFQELLGMDIHEFQELPLWKQIDIKKKIGLF